jgi:hypothetical protein
MKAKFPKFERDQNTAENFGLATTKLQNSMKVD